MSKDAQTLSRAIGYEFSDPALLRQALTHRSSAGEPQGIAAHNERMEFLGDSVLGLVTSDVLYRRFPDFTEGDLTKIKAFLVSGENLVSVAEQLEIGRYLLLGKGEETSGGRSKKGLAVNAVEAVIAAVYLDGGIDAARRVVESLVLGEEAIESASENLERVSHKSALQEWLQARKLRLPSYRVVEEVGPPHRRTFTVEVEIDEDFRAEASGPSKKEAERSAAEKALAHFRSRENVEAETAPPFEASNK